MRLVTYNERVGSMWRMKGYEWGKRMWRALIDLSVCFVQVWLVEPCYVLLNKSEKLKEWIKLTETEEKKSPKMKCKQKQSNPSAISNKYGKHTEGKKKRTLVTSEHSDWITYLKMRKTAKPVLNSWLLVFLLQTLNEIGWQFWKYFWYILALNK